MRRWDDHPAPREGLCYPAQVHPSKIGLLVSLMEAYDGLAVVRTKDAAAGIIELWISPLMQADFEDFLAAARETLGLVAGAPFVANVGAPGFPNVPGKPQ